MKNLISELICTRISHDIIGNIGAVANASELLEEGDLDFLDDIKSILRTSSFNLTARMKFFRMAFGLDNNSLNDLDLVKNTCDNYLASLGNSDYPIKLQAEWENIKQVKTAMVAIMVMADLLVRGGMIKLRVLGDVLQTQISCENKISVDKWQNLQSMMDGDVAAVTANTAPLALLLEKYGMQKVVLTKDEENYYLKITEN